MSTDGKAPGDDAATGEGDVEAAPAPSPEEGAPPRPAPTPPEPPSWLTPAAALAAAGAILGGVAYYFQHGPLWVLNGLDVPIVVEIDGSRRELGPGAKASAWESTGVHRVRVLTKEGALIEEDAFHMAQSGSSACNVYNVLGAAPLYLQNIEYSSSPSKTDKEPTIEVFAGQRFVAKTGVDYVFEEPPRSISVKNAYGVIVKRHAGVGSGGWRMAAGYLAGKGQLDAAASLAQAVSRAEPLDASAAATASQLTERAAGLSAAAAMAAKQLAAAPQLEELHRQHQNQQMRLGKLAELQQEYRKWYDAGDRGPAAAAMLARVLPPVEARAVLDEALARHPDAPELLLRKGIIAAYQGEYADADALFAKAVKSPLYPPYASTHTAVLVALGRPQDAERILARLLADTSDTALAVAYVQLNQLPGMDANAGWKPLHQLAAAPERAWLGPWTSSLFGDRATPAEDDVTSADVVKIHSSAGSNPVIAWRMCAEAHPGALVNIDLNAAVLLGAESARVGDLDMAERLLSRRADLPVPWRAIAEHIRSGAEIPGAWRLDHDERAALAFVRSRALAAAGQPAQTELDLAKRLNLLPGVLSRALLSWPPPDPEPGALVGGSTEVLHRR